MPEMGIIGWIVVGFIAGALSGYFFGERSPSGCLPNIVIGVVGGILGGFVAQEMFGLDQTVGFLGALARDPGPCASRHRSRAAVPAGSAGAIGGRSTAGSRLEPVVLQE
jgi:uncharacterized membrane protein YeaQ/YmgE (transglycosylase-associated protein family)